MNEGNVTFRGKWAEFGNFPVLLAAGIALSLRKRERGMGLRLSGLIGLLLLQGMLLHAQEREALPGAGETRGDLLSRHRLYLDSARAVKKTDLKQSIEYITQSIAILNTPDYEREIAASLTELGAIYRLHGQFDLAIENLEEARSLFPTTETNLELAQAYLENAQYALAETVLLPLKEMRGLVPYRQVVVFEQLGDAYKGLGNTEEALVHYRHALAVADQNQIAPKVADLNSRIGAVFEQEDRLQEAGAYYRNSLELSSQQAPARAVREKEKVADFYNRSRKYEEEIALRKKSLQEIREQPEMNSEPDEVPGDAAVSAQGINYKIANAYIAQDQYDQAIPYLRESIRMAGADRDLQVQKDATRTLSEVYREKGDFNAALETYRQYVALVDSLYRQKEEELSQVARVNREIAEKQSRITGLEQERALNRSRYDLALSEQELIRERSKRQGLLIYFLVAGMLLLALTAYFFYRSNRQQKLANTMMALKSLRTQMNPHFIFNALNSVNQYIARNDERSANRYLGEFSSLMRAVLENSEHDFISLESELEMLRLYLRLEHARFPESFDYRITIDEGVDPKAYQVPPMIIQPFLENAIWHGLRYKEEKGLLELRLEETGQDALLISVLDNGIGRKRSAELKTDHQRKRNSKGMKNIHSRIAILNDLHPGSLEVTVKDGEEGVGGTRVRIKLKRHT